MQNLSKKDQRISAAIQGLLEQKPTNVSEVLTLISSYVPSNQAVSVYQRLLENNIFEQTTKSDGTVFCSLTNTSAEQVTDEQPIIEDPPDPQSTKESESKTPTENIVAIVASFVVVIAIIVTLAVVLPSSGSTNATVKPTPSTAPTNVVPPVDTSASPNPTTSVSPQPTTTASPSTSIETAAYCPQLRQVIAASPTSTTLSTPEWSAWIKSLTDLGKKVTAAGKPKTGEALIKYADLLTKLAAAGTTPTQALKDQVTQAATAASALLTADCGPLTEN